MGDVRSARECFGEACAIDGKAAAYVAWAMMEAEQEELSAWKLKMMEAHVLSACVLCGLGSPDP